MSPDTASLRALRAPAFALALAAFAFPLAGCGDDTADGAADGADGDSGAGGGAPACGTASEPTLLTLRDVIPAPGTVVASEGVVHGFTIVGAPGIIQSLTLQAEATHTAGVPDPAQLSFTIEQQGGDLVYAAAPVAWTTAPSHVELSVSGAFEAEGCVYAFPSPVFSYDVEPGGGAGGGGEGGGGDGGSTGEGGAGGG